MRGIIDMSNNVLFGGVHYPSIDSLIIRNHSTRLCNHIQCLSNTIIKGDVCVIKKEEFDDRL